MNEKTAGLAKARAERSLKKRRAVEDALSELKARNETITFKAVATLAGVGRPYLYNNFREIIEAERKKSRSAAATIDGVTVPQRTTDESRHIEALLRKKVDKLKAELGDVRRENSRLKTALEKERGLSEHYRQNWIKARSE